MSARIERMEQEFRYYPRVENRSRSLSAIAVIHNFFSLTCRYERFLSTHSSPSSTSLDLHGLTVAEALEQLQWFIGEVHGQADEGVQ